MRVLITGAAGRIGSVLRECLSKRYEVVGIDKNAAPDVEEIDIVRDTGKLNTLLRGIDAVVHLAWDTREAGIALEPICEENKRMGENILALSLQNNVRRIILASSVHTVFGHIGHERLDRMDGHYLLHRERKITVHDEPYPLGVYGASKVYLEMLGKVYARRGLQVIAARFGNVTVDDSHGEYPVWLSHKDCCQFVERCIEAENLQPYSTVFAVSDNACNPFDIETARRKLGYQPQDGSPCPIS